MLTTLASVSVSPGFSDSPTRLADQRRPAPKAPVRRIHVGKRVVVADVRSASVAVVQCEDRSTIVVAGARRNPKRRQQIVVSVLKGPQRKVLAKTSHVNQPRSGTESLVGQSADYRRRRASIKNQRAMLLTEPASSVSLRRQPSRADTGRTERKPEASRANDKSRSNHAGRRRGGARVGESERERSCPSIRFAVSAPLRESCRPLHESARRARRRLMNVRCPSP